MSLFELDAACQAPMDERKRFAQAGLARLIADEKSGVYEAYRDANVRVATFRNNLAHGFFVVPEGALVNSERGFSAKRGPFIEYLGDRDLRPVQQELTRLTLPATAIDTRDGEIIPAQLVGFRTGLKGTTRYEALWTDALAAEAAYAKLRAGKPKIVSRREGRVEIDYHDGIGLTIHGLRRWQPGFITATLEGIPPHGMGVERKTHDPHYRLEALVGNSPQGVFHVDSGYTQHRGRNWVYHLYFNGHISKHSPETTRQPSVDRVALYAGDLLGLYMIAGVAQRQYGVELNQPLPRFPKAIHTLARELGERTILVDTKGRRHKPSKTEWNQLLALARSG